MKVQFIAQSALFVAASTMANADPREVKLLTPVCEDTYIAAINARLGQEENNRFVFDGPKVAGSAVMYMNGKYGVSYEYVPALSVFAGVGDKIRWPPAEEAAGLTPDLELI